MNISSGKINKAQKIVVYGPEGIGKSTFASQFPNPVFIDTEGSTSNMDVKRFDKPSSWEMLNAQIDYVITNRPCGALVIDTIDWAERLCTEHICAKHNKDGIEGFGYGNGYTYVYEEFGRFLNKLNDVAESGINVVLIAHAQLRKFSQPDEIGEYDRWELKLGKKTSSQTSPIVKEWADAVLFVNYKTYSIAQDKDGKKFKAQGGSRVMYTQHHPCWDAKNRFGLPEETDFNYSVIAPYIQSGNPANIPPIPNPQPPTAPIVPIQPIAPIQPAAPANYATENITPPVQPKPPVLPPNNNAAKNFGDLNDFKELGTGPDIPPDIPKPLADLMRQNGVSEEEIRFVVSNKGFYPVDMPISRYDPGFINGAIIAKWQIFYGVILENRKVPFTA